MFLSRAQTQSVHQKGGFYLRPPASPYFILATWIVIALLFSTQAMAVQAAVLPAQDVTASALGHSPENKIDPQLQMQLEGLTSSDMPAVIVTLADQLDLHQAAAFGPGNSRQERIIRSLQSFTHNSQKEIKRFLQDNRFAGKFRRAEYFWIFNGLALQAAPEVIQALANRPDVQHIEPNRTLRAPTVLPAAGNAWDNLGKINAPKLWALGYQGQGVVVANIDTGVEASHPEISGQWRGGSNSWFDPADPAGLHPTPVDLPASCSISGHGTGTMGVMVGKSVGVAPDAQWISVKIFDDSTCKATDSNAILGLQWVLDPDGDPSTPDAPQVVNNSWGGSGCDTPQLYINILQTLRAAGIMPVFAAGNSGSAGGVYPATDPGAFSVGATDSADQIAAYSSLGPNKCVTTPSTFPLLSAPGDYIRTSSTGGSYAVERGTSFSAPHVAGTLALLLSAFPQGLTVEQQETALTGSAVDFGTPGPDNVYGFGRLDALRAYQWLLPDTLLGFDTPSQTVIETNGSTIVHVYRSGGLSFPIAVDIAVTGGTAVAGIDYTLLAPTQLDFAPGETQKSFEINLLSNNLPGPDKVLLLSLTNPQVLNPSGIYTAGINTSTSRFTLTIMNTDPWVVMLPWIVQ